MISLPSLSRKLAPLPVLVALTAAPPEPGGLPFEISALVEKVGPGELWPGFDPARIPLAISDGERTYLFRHPQPPPEFLPVPGRPGALVASGEQSPVRANTSVTLAGVPTATLLLDSSRNEARSARELAAIAVHEAFHVHQASRHPKWGGNEVDLFTYPVDDVRLGQLARLETEALRRALAARRPRETRCWAAAALDARRRRFEVLGAAGSAYERGTELKEGLARLVEARFAGRQGPPLQKTALPSDDFPADQVRSRSYAFGHALALLLDRSRKGWEAVLDSRESATLDELLAEALTESRRCAFSRAESDRALAGAQRSVELAAMTRDAVRRDFLRREGWTVVVVAASEPLFPQAFDPLNFERIGRGDILHTRWVKLGNSAGAIEVLNARALTEAAGSHPLFEGIRRVTVTGLSQDPEVPGSGDSVVLRAPGLEARFRGAQIRREGRSLAVVLPGP